MHGYSLLPYAHNKDKDFVRLDADDFTELIHMGVSATNDKLKYSYNCANSGCYGMLKFYR